MHFIWKRNQSQQNSIFSTNLYIFSIFIGCVSCYNANQMPEKLGRTLKKIFDIFSTTFDNFTSSQWLL